MLTSHILAHLWLRLSLSFNCRSGPDHVLIWLNEYDLVLSDRPLVVKGVGEDHLDDSID